MISSVIEVILMSICSAVMPRSVPATLKSMRRMVLVMRMSDSTAKARLFIGPSRCRRPERQRTPASINASEAPHTDAIDDEPFDSVIRTRHGSFGGSNGRTAPVPWPISRRLGTPRRPRQSNRAENYNAA